MDPLTVGILGTSILGGLVQYYNAEKARGAEKKRLKEIEKLFNDIKPPDYDVSIIQPPEMHAQELRKPEFSSAMAAPQWNLAKLDLKELNKVQDFVPEIAPLIEEAKPQLIEMNQDMKEGRDAQKAALSRFMEIGQGDYDPEYQQRVLEAKRRAQSEAQSRADSITQDFERRGLSGSGLELAAKIGTAAEAMDRNAMMGLDAETQAYRNQLNALAQGAQLGGQIQSQEQAFQAMNADIVNAFNQRMSKRHQDWEQMRADALNAADLRNIQEAQRIADFNVNQGNQQMIADRQRMDDITRYNADWRRGERDRSDDLSKWGYDTDLANRIYEDQANILKAKWMQDNIDRGNTLQDRNFQNNMSVARGKAGIADARTAADIRKAQDINQAIGGFTNLGTTILENKYRNNQRQPYGDGYSAKPQYSYNMPKTTRPRKPGYVNYGTGGMYS